MTTKSQENTKEVKNVDTQKSPESTTNLELEIMKLRAELYKKIHQVQAQVETVGKSGKNTQQNYDYTMEEDILKAIKPLLQKNNLAVIPTAKSYQVREAQSSKGGVNYMTRVCMEYRICDVETGYSEKVHFFGEGFDPLDKGVYKAYTGANKYMLAKTFLLPTSDDPENDQPKQGQSRTKNKQSYNSGARTQQSSTQQQNVGEGVMSEAQNKKIFALIKQKNFDDDKVKAWILKTWGIESRSELFKRNDGKKIASTIIEALDKKPANAPKEAEPKAGNEVVEPSEIPDDL